MSTTTINQSVPPAIETRPQRVRRHETWSPGDCAHQGDLIFVCIHALPPGMNSRENRQLADGDTRGSRHVVEGGNVYDGDAAVLARAVRKATGDRVSPSADYIGPVFTGPCVVTHPTHQHQAFPAGTVTVTVYQRNFTIDQREMRADD